MLTVIIFIIVIGVLVLVHEFGHFVMAKRAGMKVEEFGFGFPPRLWGVKRGETIYSINWIPFGGFVKIAGEDGDERGPRTFASASFTQRTLVLVAGVTMNVILAAVLLIIVNFLGLRVGILDSDHGGARNIEVQIVDVASGSPADKAGIQPLDTIAGYQDAAGMHPFDSTASVQDAVTSHLDEPLTLDIQRGGQTIEKTVTPLSNHPADQGALGVSLVLTGIVSYPWYTAIWRGAYDAVILTAETAVGYWDLLKMLVTHGTVGGEVSGPIGIATLTGQAARVGFNYLLQFVAMISVNLAILNIIPFPALDGGRVLMLIIEKIKKSPVRPSVENAINVVGFYLLIALMVYATYHDIAKLFVQ